MICLARYAGCGHAKRRDAKNGARRIELNTVENIEGFRSELEAHTFRDGSILGQGEVKIVNS